MGDQVKETAPTGGGETGGSGDTVPPRGEQSGGQEGGGQQAGGQEGGGQAKAGLQEAGAQQEGGGQQEAGASKAGRDTVPHRGDAPPQPTGTGTGDQVQAPASTATGDQQATTTNPGTGDQQATTANPGDQQTTTANPGTGDQQATTPNAGNGDQQLAAANGDQQAYKTPEQGSPEYNARVQELAKDPADGGKVTPESTREAQVGLEMERNGALAGPIERAPLDNSNPAFQKDQGDFIDANGQRWDVKSPNEYYRSGDKQGELMPPEQPGRYNGETFERQVDGELAKGEHVIVDTKNLTDESAADVRQRVAAREDWNGKVLVYDDRVR
ncbi:hypothetical protein KZZ52_05500 [Dactylosporangium sp. AC04546]|uniref:hypothetical protein n=1 Tax=Dactylosporangium sp. AC04546 TaxID=2862460 RepID=UPI001EDE49F8|nr:hypothetical protein [Dactylosporangium sp. AC04546]WVK84862.1 hypothetical protein KZZ52_05500 [Dactylosporangium sp. AC04546]